MIDGMGMMGMMVCGLLSMLLALVVLLLFILAAAYGVKWVWGQRASSTTGRDESALNLVKSDMRKARSAEKSLNGSRRKSNNF